MIKRWKDFMLPQIILSFSPTLIFLCKKFLHIMWLCLAQSRLNIKLCLDTSICADQVKLFLMLVFLCKITTFILKYCLLSGWGLVYKGAFVTLPCTTATYFFSFNELKFAKWGWKLSITCCSANMWRKMGIKAKKHWKLGILKVLNQT